MSRIEEGNTVPGNPFTGDDLPAPRFCPVCGRELTATWSWVTIDGRSEYPQIVCYGGQNALAIRWGNWFSATAPMAAHYVFRLPSRPTTQGINFDRMTGRPTRSLSKNDSP